LGAILNLGAITQHNWNSIIISAVMETLPEPETAVLRQNCGELKPRVFGAKWIRFRLPTYKANELVQARRLKVPSKSSASA